MGTKYEQLSLEERCALARLHADGQAIRQIAASMGRAASTISRELKRNRGQKVGYQPAYAGDQAWARRWRGSRLARQPALQHTVLSLLAMGWSPEQVAGWMAREHGSAVISHESIYRFIYAQIRRTKNYDWRRYLPRAKSKRGYRGRRGGSPVENIKDRISITQRPPSISKRLQPGHWEADLLLFSRYGQAVLVAQERASRLILIPKQPNKPAEPIADRLHAWLAPLPQPLRQTITFDNGTEFALHHKLRDSAGIATFFCNPHSPWQKGGIENANGRIRRFLPRKTNLSDLNPDHLSIIARRYNNTPRKCLGFKTPAEVFYSHLLHFKRESTFPFSRE